MRETLAVYRKEMRAYLVSPIPYLFVAIFAAVVSWWFFWQTNFFLLKLAKVDGMLRFIPWAFVFTVPAVTMRLWSEEFRGGTFETLLTMPVRPRHLVLGKFFAAWTVLGVCLLSTAGIPVTVASIGDLDMGPVWGGYLGALLMGAAFLALGQWVSGLTRNQIVAFLVALVACFVLVMLDQFGDSVGAWAEQLSVSSHFRSITRGVVDVRDLAYFASFIVFFLYLNAESIDNRRHR
jgi:ABC-2 type transport system permease protein